MATGEKVRARVAATALNRADLLQRRGLYPAPPGVVQDIPGLEFVGYVDQVGDGVTATERMESNVNIGRIILTF